MSQLNGRAILPAASCQVNKTRPMPTAWGRSMALSTTSTAFTPSLSRSRLAFLAGRSLRRRNEAVKFWKSGLVADCGEVRVVLKIGEATVAPFDGVREMG